MTAPPADGRSAQRGPDRGLLLMGALVVLVGGLTIYRLESDGTQDAQQEGRATPSGRAKPSWLEQARVGCKPGQVASYVDVHPPPRPTLAYRVVCHALAAEMEAARKLFAAEPKPRQQVLAQTVFAILHPIADAGDDRAAGPGMELVLEYSPNNVQAMFHAGMAAYEKADDARAVRHLERFLRAYPKKDMWNKRATRALEAIERIRSGESEERPKIRTH